MKINGKVQSVVNPGPENSVKRHSMVHMKVQSQYWSSTDNPRVKLDEIKSIISIKKEADIYYVCQNPGNMTRSKMIKS